MKQYVIVGNGVAAAGCIEGIRNIDQASPITVISEENHPVYGRPLISYYLEGKTDPAHMLYREPDFYDQNGCTVLYGRKAVKISKRPKRVLLDDHTELPWSSLCIASGSGPFVLTAARRERQDKPGRKYKYKYQRKCFAHILSPHITLYKLYHI